MLRSVLSVITVVLLATIAFLLYSNYKAPAKSVERLKDLSGLGAPPPPPVKPAAPTVAPPVSPPQLFPPVPPPPRAITAPPALKKPALVETPCGKKTHVVQPGDSLWSISKSYYGTAEHYNYIAAANGLRGDSKIRAGQVLCLPNLPAEAVEKDKEDHETQTAHLDDGPFEPLPPTLSAKGSRQ